MLIPAALGPGDLIDVIAPSSPFDRTLAWKGLGWLGQRYRIRFDRGIFQTQGYLAGSDDRRARELDRALRASDSKAVVAVRGGYGLHRIAPKMDWEAFRSQPKWLVGFSDITVLHVEAMRAGVASMHAPMVAALGQSHEPTRRRWIEALEAPTQPRQWAGLGCLRPGRVAGTSVGGNLTVLHACAAAGRLSLPDDAIIFLEDVGERPYRIDRMLTTLITAGGFEKARGMVLGEFTNCYPGTDRMEVMDVFCDLMSAFSFPTIIGFPMGHGELNDPLPLGVPVELDAKEAGSMVSVFG